MIHAKERRINTFLEENVLIDPGCLIDGLGEQDRSIRQAKPWTRYENREFPRGILSGKVASFRTRQRSCPSELPRRLIDGAS